MPPNEMLPVIRHLLTGGIIGGMTGGVAGAQKSERGQRLKGALRGFLIGTTAGAAGGALGGAALGEAAKKLVHVAGGLAESPVENLASEVGSAAGGAGSTLGGMLAGRRLGGSLGAVQGSQEAPLEEKVACPCPCPCSGRKKRMKKKASVAGAGLDDTLWVAGSNRSWNGLLREKDTMEKEAMTQEEALLFENVYLPAFVEKCAEFGITFPDRETLDTAIESAALLKQAIESQGSNTVKQASIALKKALGLDQSQAAEQVTERAQKVAAALTGQPDARQAWLNLANEQHQPAQ